MAHPPLGCWKLNDPPLTKGSKTDDPPLPCKIENDSPPACTNVSLARNPPEDVLSIIRWTFDLSLEKMYSASGLSLHKQNIFVAVVAFQVGLISRFTLHNRSLHSGVTIKNICWGTCNYSHFPSLLRLINCFRSMKRTLHKGGEGEREKHGDGRQNQSLLIIISCFSSVILHCTYKDVRADCFCASLLRTQLMCSYDMHESANSHTTSCTRECTKY